MEAAAKGPIAQLEEHSRRRVEGHRRALERFDRVYTRAMATGIALAGLFCLTVPLIFLAVDKNVGLAILAPGLVSGLLAFSAAKRLLASLPKRDALSLVV